MERYSEIITKRVIGKGKKIFRDQKTIIPTNIPTTILGCWVVNHQVKGYKNNDKINVEGSYDVNIWYAFDDNSKTDVMNLTDTYKETVSLKNVSTSYNTNEEVIIRSLKDPVCLDAIINEGNINYVVEKELGIEIIGDAKVKVLVEENDEVWDELEIDNIEKINEAIDEEVQEEYFN
ncbi:MAG: outer spore coat protein CotE [Bacilli bacterium]